MNAVLRVNGGHPNFYRWPLKTYSEFKNIVSEESKNTLASTYSKLQKRFIIFGVLLLISLILYPLAIIVYSTPGCFG